MNIDLSKRIEEYGKKHILVIGDVMLDKYIFGKIDRVSPEAPVPVIREEKINYNLGGAANVARNINGLGGQASLIGLIGQDSAGECLKSITNKDSIRINFDFIEDKSLQTTVKTRIIGQGQHIARLDRESECQSTPRITKILKEKIRGLINEVDGIILQDYDKGVLGEELIKFVMEKSLSQSIPVYVDPKNKHFLLYSGARFFKPNQFEFKKEIGYDDDVVSAGVAFRQKLNLDILMVTMSEKGMYLFQENQHTHIETKARSVHDVSGAGDTVISTFALNDICGVDPDESAFISNLAAGRVCEEIGVVPITSSIMTEIINHHSK
tara:strand:- start:138 stop:1109 length:972 start_codon:yes stop_codon:yes gene_type:complete